MRTGFLEDGLLVVDHGEMAKRYLRSKRFVADVISLIPLDLASSQNPLLRFPRFIKVYRAKEFYRKVQWLTPSPTSLRVINLVHALMLILHWFACFYFMVSLSEGFSTQPDRRGWSYPLLDGQPEWGTLSRKYLHSLYWSFLTLTMIGEKQSPDSNVQ
ncbi:unnamed protein product [Clavelina lepadiformis]|uniref:Ion transport domain-containing protein n=1 Tax=Clavelina lepadiformis TaxID=159417 RepID=A0ABP0GJM0_CLALP